MTHILDQPTLIEATEDDLRTCWRLDDWNCYFSQGKPAMTEREISRAITWLTKHDYPIPQDCPTNRDCPEFRPICQIGNQCRVARRMCGYKGGTVKCTTCDHMIDAATEFRDALSRKEYDISGMCQKCQDGVFTSSEKDPCENCGKKGTDYCKNECPI